MKDTLEQYLLRLLSSGYYTRKQLLDKLIRKGAEKPEAEEILQEYSTYGYVDDLIYAKLYIDSHEQWGILRLRTELRARGISDMVIDEALEEVEPDEIFRAEKLARSWLDSDISKEKILSRLARRGFTFHICREALNRACEESL